MALLLAPKYGTLTWKLLEPRKSGIMIFGRRAIVNVTNF